MELGSVGLFSYQIRFLSPDKLAGVAQVIERLGFSALWLPGGNRAGLFADVRTVLESTTNLAVATGIVPIFKIAPEDVAASFRAIEAELPGRLMVGLGVGHREDVGDDHRHEFDRPRRALERYLDALERLGGPGQDRLLLGAQGPRMLDLARERSAGAHPYNVTPAHTAAARERLGPARLLAPEQAVVLGDRSSALAIARRSLVAYLARANYTTSWRRQGFDDEDLLDGGSDELVEALIACGSVQSAVDRVDAHRRAGADHVCIQVITDQIAELRADWPDLDVSALVDAWTRLSETLGLNAG